MTRDHQQWRDDTHAIGRALVDAAPPQWRCIELQCKATVDVQTYTVTVVLADGTTVEAPVPDEVPPAVLRIRKAFYLPGEGTWFSFRYLVDAPGKLQSLYNVDWDPELDGNPELWVRDLAAFPRSPEHTPGWLRAKLAEAGQVVPAVAPVPTPEQLWRLVSERIVAAVPVDWLEIHFSWDVHGRAGLESWVRRVSTGERYSWQPPVELGDLLAVLRTLTHRPGRGAWQHVRALIDRSSDADYFYTWFPEQDPIDVTIDEADPGAAVRRAASDLGVPEDRFRLGSVADGAWCLVREGERWAVFRAEGANRPHESTFATEAEAAEDLVKRMYRDHAVFWSATPADAKRQSDEWPIQPVGGDVGLQMYRGKHLGILAPGTELDRYGGAEGNTLYAAGTAFHRRSEPDAVLEMDFHVYRLRKPVRAVSGTARAWYDQPGGGTAHVLEHPVAHYLATGALEEVVTEQPKACNRS